MSEFGFCYKCTQPSRNLTVIVVKGRAGAPMRRKICSSCESKRQPSQADAKKNA